MRISDVETGKKRNHTEDVIWRVSWDDSADSYLYGSRLSFRQDLGVLLENRLIPPGFPVMRWSSTSHFQEKRREPQLPPLRIGEEYHLRAFAQTRPEARAFFQIHFFDSLQRPIETRTGESLEFSFQCPPDCCRWELELRNGGFTTLVFQQIELMTLSAWEKRWNGEKALPGAKNLLLLEPTGSASRCPEDALLKQIPNLAILPAEYLRNRILRRKITGMLPKQPGCLIGYGPRGNAAAVEMGAALGWPALVSGEGLSGEQKRGPGVFCYGREETAGYPLLSGLVDCRERLKQLPVGRLRE